MRFTGKLFTWNEDRGFGFIRPSDGGQDIFVHVSALPMPRPQPDEVLTFEVGLNQEGKKKATNVMRQQVEASGLSADAQRTAPRGRSRRRSERDDGETGGGWGFKLVLALVLFGGVGWFAYHRYERSVAVLPAVIPDRCDGRRFCSQMTSCSEAKFFLRNCPGTQMDGNNDGTPCEQQWCSYPWSR